MLPTNHTQKTIFLRQQNFFGSTIEYGQQNISLTQYNFFVHLTKSFGRLSSWLIQAKNLVGSIKYLVESTKICLIQRNFYAYLRSFFASRTFFSERIFLLPNCKGRLQSGLRLHEG